jgi:molybdenum cofactor cytidylyltransferase
MISTLQQAFRLGPAPRLALVGAGGKSTCLFRLAREYPAPLLLGCTAHLALEQSEGVDHHIIVQSSTDIPRTLGEGQTLFTGVDNGKGRWSGLPPETLPALQRLADELQTPLLFESDGSRCLPIKAWETYEPPIPPFADTVVVCVGLSALGQPLDESHVFRASIFSQLSGLPLGEKVTLSALAAVLCHPLGGQKNIPAAARRICLLNQADTPALQAQAQSLARHLLGSFAAVVITTLNQPPGHAGAPKSIPGQQPFAGIHAVYEAEAGVILAAGGASRMGQPKLLLDWHGEAIIRHSVKSALQAGLDPVVVVTGAHVDGVSAALADLPVKLVHNPDWNAGQSTSVKIGLSALPPETGAVAFLLGDQPQIPPTLVRALLEQHRRTLAPITCPLIAQQRGNPVLFDRVTFPEFYSLEGDAGARQIFSRHPLDYLPWHDQSLLMDVDTPDDYNRLTQL